MARRLIGPLLVAAGILMLCVSLFANILGRYPLGYRLGLGHDPGFGAQQLAGTVLGAAVLVFGAWIWTRARSGWAARAGSVIATLLVIGGLVYVVGEAAPRPEYLVEACAEANPVPLSAAGAGHVRVDYGARITNLGPILLTVDSIVVRAHRDSAAAWLPATGVAGIWENIRWEGIDSTSLTLWGRIRLDPGQTVERTRPIIIAVEEGRPQLYMFGATVWVAGQDPERPRAVATGPVWLDGLRDTCP